MHITILIPAYMPEDILPGIAKELNELNFNVLIIDDGSGKKYDSVFSDTGKYAKVLHHEYNMGKGAALKTGFREIKNFFPDTEAIITADADGQHSIVDICSVADLLENGASCVITERSLGKDIPFRSKFGNDLSRFVYAATTGRYLYDTQSGLRGFKVEHCNWLINVKGEKYDYEMGVLIHLDKMNVPITRLPIKTIYINSNSSSHFNPVKDTLRIYMRFANTLWYSLISSIVNIIAVIALLIVTGSSYWPAIIILSGVVFTSYSILMNKFTVFKKMSNAILLRMALLSLLRILFSLGICGLGNLIGMPAVISFIISRILLLPLEFALPYFKDKLQSKQKN